MAKEKSILTVPQKQVLEIISREDYFCKKFYLAGGTALSEFYLKHRISEDLDFFSEKEEVNPIYINRFFKEQERRLEFKKIETKRIFGLYNYFLRFKNGEVLKVDFGYYPFPRIEKGTKFNNLEIEDIYDIGVDKVHTAVLQPRARDFIDLYFIIKEKNYQFKDLLMKAKAKFDWDINQVELGARLMQAAKITDYPRMLKKIKPEQWKNFFIQYAKNLRGEIFK